MSTLNLQTSFGIYIHWPYCLAKCPYCDFNSHVRPQIEFDPWYQGILAELKYYAARTADKKVSSIFFGGGTPSLLPPQYIAGIIDAITKHWQCDADMEITLEANPTSVEAGRFEGYRAGGVNRLSIGVQSLRGEDLKFLGRMHNVDEARGAIALAQKYFERYSFDLIYARPGQTLKAWEIELKEALLMAGGHLSLYQLTIEPGTAFETRYKRGEFTIPSPDEAADLYIMTEELLGSKGYEAYEVSNYAKPLQASRHNLVYWRYQDYLGIGPGAHGRLSEGDSKRALVNHKSPELWLENVKKNGIGLSAQDKLDEDDIALERLMMGLRLYEGVEQKYLDEVILTDPFLEKRLSDLQEEGLLIRHQNRIALTQNGRLKLNSVLGYVLRRE